MEPVDVLRGSAGSKVGSEIIDQIRDFPRESAIRFGVSSKMSVCRSSCIDWAIQSQMLTHSARDKSMSSCNTFASFSSSTWLVPWVST